MNKTGNDTVKKINEEIKSLKVEIDRINSNHDYVSDAVLEMLLRKLHTLVSDAKLY